MTPPFKRFALLLMVLTGIAPAADLTLTPQTDGLHIASPDSHLLLPYPTLIDTKKTKHLKPQKTTVTSDHTATIDYDGDLHLQLTVNPAAGDFTYSTANPGDIKYLEIRTDLPITLKTGGTYQFGTNPAQPFPADYPGKPHLYQGNASPFLLRTPDGQDLLIQPPASSYQEPNDLREWNTPSFHWMSQPSLGDNTPRLTYHLEIITPVAPAPNP